jgi:hypothetical protein
MEIDHDTLTVRVDWHQYAPDQVETWSDLVIEAAFAHGFRYVEFVHGASDVMARGTPGYQGDFVEGRGRIKEILRRRLYRGRWRHWVADRREGLHDVTEGRMLVALRENPTPTSDARWPVIPPTAY